MKQIEDEAKLYFKLSRSLQCQRHRADVLSRVAAVCLMPRSGDAGHLADKVFLLIAVLVVPLPRLAVVVDVGAVLVEPKVVRLAAGPVLPKKGERER